MSRPASAEDWIMTSKAYDLQLNLPQSLFGYDVLEFLGEGAASAIYAVSDPQTKQLYALKYVVRKTDKHERFIEQLHNELHAGQSVSHPSLRRIIDLKVNRTLLRRTIDAALIMELFDGEPLENRPPRTILESLDRFIQVGQGIEAIHAAGFVHSDLKPNNILLGADGSVRVIDLGQACKSGTIKPRVQGTPDYMAPEQVKCQPVTFRTDIFNFGTTLYWTLCGKHIPTLFRIKKAENSFLLDAQMAAPHAMNPHVPETLSNLVMECVRSSASKRPETMSDVVRRLEIMRHALQRDARAASADAATAIIETAPSRRSPSDNRALRPPQTPLSFTMTVRLLGEPGPPRPVLSLVVKFTLARSRGVTVSSHCSRDHDPSISRSHFPLARRRALQVDDRSLRPGPARRVNALSGSEKKVNRNFIVRRGPLGND